MKAERRQNIPEQKKSVFFPSIENNNVLFSNDFNQNRGNAMALNNTVTLTGNIGKEPRIIEDGKSPFAAFSLATTDSYKDKDGNWRDRETVWHEVIAFDPKLIERAKGLETKTRIQVTGSLSYRFFDAVVEEGKTVKKKEATIVARKIEDVPLPSQEPG